MRIGATAAQIAGHVFADLGIGACMTFLDAGDCRHDLARRAVAALEGILSGKGGLHRVQLGTLRRQTFDSRDRTSLNLCSEREAGENALAADMDRTGSALPLVATLLRAGEAQILAQGIEQRDSRLNRQLTRLSIDFKLQFQGFRHDFGPHSVPSKGMTFRYRTDNNRGGISDITGGASG